MRNSSGFSLAIVKTLFSRLETVSCLDPKLWEIVPTEITVVDSSLEFKNKIRLWNPNNCSCWIYKKYIHNVVFIKRFSRHKSVDMLYIF